MLPSQSPVPDRPNVSLINKDVLALVKTTTAPHTLMQRRNSLTAFNNLLRNEKRPTLKQVTFLKNF